MTMRGEASEARARWRVASDRLWPLAMVDPDGYRRAAELVGTLLESLRASASTVDDLVALEPSAATVLPDGAAVPFGGPSTLVAAACAIRADEIDPACLTTTPPWFPMGHERFAK